MKDLKLLGMCGPARHFKAATVFITEYPADGSVALVAAPGTSDQQVYSVCLANGPPAKQKTNHVWLKGWSENEGVPEALEEAGLVKLTGETWPTGFVEAQEAILLGVE
jgi:hypothetical protein